jgi:hypothetical protein
MFFIVDYIVRSYRQVNTTFNGYRVSQENVEFMFASVYDLNSIVKIEFSHKRTIVLSADAHISLFVSLMGHMCVRRHVFTHVEI